MKVYWSYSDDIINHKLTIILFVVATAPLHFSTNFLLEVLPLGLMRSENTASDWVMKMICYIHSECCPLNGFPGVSIELNDMVIVSGIKLPRNCYFL